MSKNLALLLLFAAAALLGGFLLLASDPSAEADGEDLRRAGAASETGEVGPSEGAELVTVAAEAAERSREAAAAPGGPGAAGGPVDAAPSGAPAAEVRGQVVDAQGRAIPGASLRLTQPGDGGEGTVEAEADGEGAFSLMGVGGGGTLLVRADGYVPLERDVRLETASTVALGQLAMSVAGRVSGRVVDPEGRGIAGARISASNDLSLAEMLRGLGNPGDAVESGPDGRFTIATLRPGPYAFRVRRDGFLDGAFKGELAREGAEVDGVLVTLDPGVAITGRVTGLPSADAADALEVAVRSAGSEGALALEVPFGDGPFGGRAVKLSADGTFRAAGLQAGRRYELFLRAPKAGPIGGAAQRSSVVEARAGDRGVALGYSEGASVRFVLVDGSGAPVTRAEVSAGLERPRLRIREGDPLPEGAVEVRGLFPKAGGQPLQLSVRAPGKAPWSAEGLRLAPEEALDLGRVTLLDRGQVRVTVRSAAGDAVEGAEVRLVAAATANPGGSRVIRRSMRLSGDLDSPEGLEGLEGLLDGEGPGAVGRTDGAGVCTLDADAGSRVDVRVTHPEHAPSRSGPVEVLAVGQVTEHEVRLAAPGWVAVSVVDAKGNPVPDALVESRQSGSRRSGSAPVRTDASGRVQVGPLAAGTARFRLGEESRGPRFAISLSVEADAAGGGGWSEVQVTAGEVATLTLVAPNRVVVTGVVTEGGQPLAGATVVLEARSDGDGGLGFLGFGSDGPTEDTDGRGAFRLEDVEEGEYALKVRHPERAMEESFDVEVEAIDTRFEVDLAVTVIEGRVTDASGDPVVDAEVTARRKRPSGGPTAMIAISTSDGGPQVLSFGGLGGRALRTDADGRYRLRGVVPGVPLIVAASEPSLGSTESEPLEVEAGSLTVDVDLTFVRPGQVTVRVEGLQADALSAPLALARLDGSGQPTAEFVRDGVASFKGLEPGAYTFSIVGLGEGVTVEPDSIDLDVGAGDELEATFTVRR